MTEHPLTVQAFDTVEELGQAAARDVAAQLRTVIAERGQARVVFAAAASQRATLHALASQDVDWSRVHAFHMDEYLGLPADASQRFGLWLRRNFFDRVDLASVHLIEPGADADETAADYARALSEQPIDVVCLGIGQNGHLAFNDPPVADLHDPQDVKVVELDDTCRSQQVDDGEFATFDDVPTHAITLTIPRLLRAGALFCVVPGERKRWAVQQAIEAPIGAAHPATALRLHPNCTLYLDAESNPDA